MLSLCYTLTSASFLGCAMVLLHIIDCVNVAANFRWDTFHRWPPISVENIEHPGQWRAVLTVVYSLVCEAVFCAGSAVDPCEGPRFETPLLFLLLPFNPGVITACYRVSAD